ncbi:unnamed protein product [Pleuronectes platessa]|uniref:Uncharacterized protein n=1 Tax=Pleuronectes platessa TaxID=8262 RepID=A0A9N7VUX8_PLEPL|nr:unnamed protein product [Pleuronectes platessa]
MSLQREVSQVGGLALSRSLHVSLGDNSTHHRLAHKKNLRESGTQMHMEGASVVQASPAPAQMEHVSSRNTPALAHLASGCEWFTEQEKFKKNKIPCFLGLSSPPLAPQPIMYQNAVPRLELA